MRTKICLCAFLIGALLLVSGCAQSVTSYRQAEENYFSNVKSTADEFISESKKALSTPIQASADLLLNEDLGEDFSEIFLDIDTAKNNESAYGTVSFSLDDININAEYWIDEAERKSYAFLPEISDIYAFFDYSEYLPKKDYSNISADILGIFEDTSEVYFELVGEPEIVTEQELKVNDIVCIVDKFNVKLDSVSLAKIAEPFINNVLENENIVDFLCQTMGYENKEELVYYQGLDEFIDYLDGVISGDETENISFNTNVYLKGCDVIGREISLSNVDESENVEELAGIKFNLYEILTENGQTVTYLDFNVDEEDLTITLKDIKNGSEHSGSLNAVSYGEGCTVNYDSLAISKDLFQGTIKITSVSDSQFTVEVKLSTEENTKIAEISIADIGTLKISVKPSELKAKEIPAPAKGKYFDIFSELENAENPSEEMQTFVKDIVEYVMSDFIPEDLVSDSSYIEIT